jgi:hypothetical protein
MAETLTVWAFECPNRGRGDRQHNAVTIESNGPPPTVGRCWCGRLLVRWLGGGD